MPRTCFAVLLCACASLTAYAQPEVGALVRSADPEPPQRRLLNTCAAPAGTVTAGDTLLVDLDTAALYFSTELIEGQVPEFGSIAQVGDSLQYVAFVSDSVAGFDVITFEACVDSAEAQCFVDSVRVGVGRRGLREDLELTVGPEDREFIDVARPSGEIFCAGVETIGDYEDADRRDARFAQGRSGPLRYTAARAPGLDVLRTVVCNVFGTCDTTVLEIFVATNTLTLPVFDDFSYAAGDPDSSIWLEDDVYVNDAFGIAPPSYGVATFDGVDAGGIAYGEGIGVADRLTTKFIDLSGANPGEVYLKFFLQRGGRSAAPEEGDEFVVEVRNDTAAWEEIAFYPGSPTSESDSAFTAYAIELTEGRFFHNEFQVRFSTFGRLTGGFDVWNLDYVRVEATVSADASFEDIALANAPPSAIAPFTALPYSQFAPRAGELLRREVPVGVYNHFPVVNNVSASELSVADASGRELLSAGLLAGTQFNLDTGYSLFVNPIPEAPLSEYAAAVEGLNEDEARALTVAYRLGIDQDQIQLPGVLRNDTASATTVIDDYFAYDDGTAELGYFAGGIGETHVVRYELVEADTLRGLQFAFPTLSEAEASSQLINLRVYIGELPGPADPVVPPDFEQISVRPFFPATNSGARQAFTTYQLEDITGDPVDVVIPAGVFYVGWQQGSDVDRPVQVGLDLNTDQLSEVFTEFGQGWRAAADVLPGVSGSLMVRPLFSAGAPGNTSSTSEAVAEGLSVFPNPSRGSIELTGIDPSAERYRYAVYDAAGHTVAEGDLGTRQLDLTLRPGLYVLRVLADRTGREHIARVIIEQ